MASGVDLIYIVITIIIVAILLIAIITLTIWGTVQTIQNGTPDTSDLFIPLDQPVSFGIQCGNYTCGTGLVCDSESQTCKKAVGQVCHVATDCVTGSFCSGICTDASPGIVTNTANSPCPCPSNMECITILDGTNQKLCKLVEGQVCTVDNDCLSNRCLSGKCSSGLPPGSSCSQSSQCQSGETCSKGFCQLIGIDTGSRGAACDNVNGPGCDVGSSCINGTCISSTGSLGAGCNLTTSACSQPLMCLEDNDFAPCKATSSNCLCYFAYTQQDLWYPNPNNCSVTKTCYGSATCNTAGTCVVPAGQSCSATSQCASGLTCSGGGTIYRLDYSYYNDAVELITTPNPVYTLENSNVHYIPISGYNSLYPVYSIIGYDGPMGDGTDNVLYYVISGVTSNPTNSGLIRMDGKSIIYGYSATSSGTMTFLDAVVLSPTLFLILFNETTTSPSMTNKTLYSFNPTTGSLVPYNVISSSANINGTQYSGTSPINAVSISASYNSDTTINVMLFTGSNVYVKNGVQTTYSLLIDSSTSSTVLKVNSTSRPKFYSTLDAPSSGNMTCTKSCPGASNVSYIYPFTTIVSGEKYNGGSLLVFNGTLRGGAFPLAEYTDNLGAYLGNTRSTVYDYSMYVSPIYGVKASYAMMIANNDTIGRVNLYISTSGISNSFPGNVDSTSRVLALESASYVYTSKSCI